MKLIALIGILVALAVPIKAKAAAPAPKQVAHWKGQRWHHVTAKRWVRHHPRFYTYRSWKRTLRHHTKAIRFSNFMIRKWQFRTRPPHASAWRCIHKYEGSWQDTGDPYWGGLQMDRSFMNHYAPKFLLRKGWADKWLPYEQMWVAENALRAGRGFYPWPNTARVCGLI